MKKVLVIDDTKNIRILLTKCLEIEGFEVINAKDGFEALLLFEKENFDLVFLDIKMPNLSGTELLKKIRAMGITIPVIIITAYATIKNAVECTKMGAVAYLQKPFTASKVRDVLNEISKQDSVNIPNELEILTRAKSLIDEKNYTQVFQMIKLDVINSTPNKELLLLLVSTIESMKINDEVNKNLKRGIT